MLKDARGNKFLFIKNPGNKKMTRENSMNFHTAGENL